MNLGVGGAQARCKQTPNPRASKLVGKAMDSLGNSNVGDPVDVPDGTCILEQEPARSLGEGRVLVFKTGS